MLKNINKKNSAVIALLVALIIGGAFAFWQEKASRENYSIVYITTGEVYVGKLATFPRLEMTDGYIFQSIKDITDPTRSNFQLNPIKEALWAPEKMVFTRENVIFYGPILKTSKIAETLAGQK